MNDEPKINNDDYNDLPEIEQPFSVEVQGRQMYTFVLEREAYGELLEDADLLEASVLLGIDEILRDKSPDKIYSTLNARRRPSLKKLVDTLYHTKEEKLDLYNRLTSEDTGAELAREINKSDGTQFKAIATFEDLMQQRRRFADFLFTGKKTEIDNILKLLQRLVQDPTKKVDILELYEGVTNKTVQTYFKLIDNYPQFQDIDQATLNAYLNAGRIFAENQRRGELATLTHSKLPQRAKTYIEILRQQRYISSEKPISNLITNLIPIPPRKTQIKNIPEQPINPPNN